METRDQGRASQRLDDRASLPYGNGGGFQPASDCERRPFHGSMPSWVWWWCSWVMLQQNGPPPAYPMWVVINSPHLRHYHRGYALAPDSAQESRQLAGCFCQCLPCPLSDTELRVWLRDSTPPICRGRSLRPLCRDLIFTPMGYPKDVHSSPWCALLAQVCCKT